MSMKETSDRLVPRTHSAQEAHVKDLKASDDVIERNSWIMFAFSAWGTRSLGSSRSAIKITRAVQGCWCTTAYHRVPAGGFADVLSVRRLHGEKKKAGRRLSVLIHSDMIWKRVPTVPTAPSGCCPFLAVMPL